MTIPQTFFPVNRSTAYSVYMSEKHLDESAMYQSAPRALYACLFSLLFAVVYKLITLASRSRKTAVHFVCELMQKKCSRYMPPGWKPFSLLPDSNGYSAIDA
jgi:hypothetical protein